MGRVLRKASFYFWLLVAAMVFLTAGWLHWISSGVGGRLHVVDDLVAHFVAHVGRMPESQDELIAKGYLKCDIVDGLATYYYKSSVDDRDVWAANPVSLDMFRVSYGARKEGLVLRDGILIDRQTGKPQLLVTGPYNWAHGPSVRPEYEIVSRHWFSLMRDASEEGK